jgi:hypothetical protein
VGRGRSSRDGPFAQGQGRWGKDRGSRRRIRRLKWHEHITIEMWLFVAAMILMIALGLPWLAKHPLHHHQRDAAGARPQ